MIRHHHQFQQPQLAEEAEAATFFRSFPSHPSQSSSDTLFEAFDIERKWKGGKLFNKWRKFSQHNTTAKHHPLLFAPLPIHW
jgi:hypothetical protein